MKGLILLLLAPVILILFITGLQTLEWWLATGEGSITTVIVIAVIVTIWIILAARTSLQNFDAALERFEKLIDKLTKRS